MHNSACQLFQQGNEVGIGSYMATPQEDLLNTPAGQDVRIRDQSSAINGLITNPHHTWLAVGNQVQTPDSTATSSLLLQRIADRIQWAEHWIECCRWEL